MIRLSKQTQKIGPANHITFLEWLHVYRKYLNGPIEARPDFYNTF